MFTDSYYPTIDGVVVSLTTTSMELKRRGHEVVVFAPLPTGANIVNPPDRVIWLPARAFGGYGGYRSALYPSSIVSTIRRENPDIIHSHGLAFAGIQALLSSRQTGIGNVMTYHTMVSDAAGFYSPPIFPLDVMVRLGWIYQRNFLKRPHAVITPTKVIREELKGHRVKTKRWEVIPTGVDCERFTPSNTGKNIRERHGIGDRPLILTVGRVAKEKNLELLLAGFKELRTRMPDAMLMIAGKGPAFDEYRALVESLGLGDSVMMPGFVPDEELPQYYAACDVFGIASKFETQGIAAIEAMATGKPVAGMNCKAIPEYIVDGENGYLFDDGPHSCARALERALSRDGSVSVNARKTALGFSLQNCTEKLIGLYHEVEERAREKLRAH